MGMFGDTKVKVLVAALFVALVVLVGIVAGGLLAALSALGSPAYAGVPLLNVMLDAAAVYVVAFLLDAMVVGVLLLALAVTVVRNASKPEMPRDDRLVRLAEKVERKYPGARLFGLSDRVEPTDQDRIDDLKRQYVEGDIDEMEYERRLQNLLGDGSVSDERVRRERERIR